MPSQFLLKKQIVYFLHLVTYVIETSVYWWYSIRNLFTSVSLICNYDCLLNYLSICYLMLWYYPLWCKTWNFDYNTVAGYLWDWIWMKRRWYCRFLACYYDNYTKTDIMADWIIIVIVTIIVDVINFIFQVVVFVAHFLRRCDWQISIALRQEKEPNVYCKQTSVRKCIDIFLSLHSALF